MNRPGPDRRGRRTGFTLFEVLLAVAVAALLMVAANVFVLSMGELWGRGSEARLFERHVRGVTRFLESLGEQAIVPSQAMVPAANPATNAPGSNATANPGGGANAANNRGTLANAAGAGTPTASPAGGAAQGNAEPERFTFDNPYGYEGGPPMLTFELDEAPGVCVWATRPLPDVVCTLQVTADEGLVLLWKSRLEEDYGKVRPRKTPISPFVQGVRFEYYDDQRAEWTRVDKPIVDPGNLIRLPQRIQLLFAYGSLTRVVSIALPAIPEGPPLR